MIYLDINNLVWELKNTARDYKGTPKEKVLKAERQILISVRKAMRDNRADIIKEIKEEENES